MGEYGPATTLVDRLIARAGSLTIDEAADLYRAYGSRFLLWGAGSEQRALSQARRAAAVAGLSREYERARRSAATEWRRGLPAIQGPWLLVGHAIANAAGALVVHGSLDEKAFNELIGPWRQAVGTMAPVGPGIPARERAIAR